MKKYSYLSVPHGITHYHKIKDFNTGCGWFGGGGLWFIYGCTRFDCLDSEKYVGIRQYTNDRFTADSLERLTADIFNFEARI